MTTNYNRELGDKYEIIRQIKQGGFGIVYYGLDKKLNKPVAIKEIAPNLVADPKYLDMFQEEALNIAKLSHNNIVHIYELKKASDRHVFIIMEYIDGIDLEKIIRSSKKSGKSIPPHLAVYVIAEICMALEYAHQRRDAFTNKPLNLVHQDISPSNIMISREGAVKLIDFGIASVKRHQKKRKDTKLRGKIPYMAPEQLIMGNHPDHRSDLFSLGLVLYEAITGERLFSSQDEVLTAGKNPKWFRKALKGKKIPAALVKILLRALEIDISKRYQTANHMYIDLLQYLIACNETGELMDDLAVYLTNHFGQTNPPITPPNYQYGSSVFPGKSTPDALNESGNPGSAANYYQSDVTTPEVSAGTAPKQITPERPQSYINPSPHSGVNHVSNFQKPDSRLADFDQPLPGLQGSPGIGTMEFELGSSEDLKTVIDIIRVSARNYKKRVLQITTGLLLALLTLAVFDTINGWTKAGVWVYDHLFPPAIELVTVPPGASISLDNQQLAGLTPLPINKINPGVHKLEISLPGYKPIVKSLFVPREGSIKVQGNETEGNSQSYLFRFSTEIMLNSTPQGADIYINGVRFNQRTPCMISWDVGAPLSLEMRKNGFETLSGYSLNTVEHFDEVEDRRLWKLEVYNDDNTRYAVTGVFLKDIKVESIPSGAEIVDVRTNQIIGVTGNSRGISLPAGKHELLFRKSNFVSTRLSVNIDESYSDKLRAVLSRKIRFTVVDAHDSERRDIGAKLISLKRNGRDALRAGRRTPVELTIPALTYTAVFSKPGYQRAQMRIESETRSIQVEMEPLQPAYEIKVIDALSEKAVTGAEIFYNFEGGSETEDALLARTDFAGSAYGQIAGGNYIIIVKKEGYKAQSKLVTARAGETLDLVIEIYPSN